MTALITTLPPSFSDLADSGSSASAAPSSGSFTFHDLLSIVNPLQHFPIVSTIYRAVTGDTIGPAERIAGDTLYGGIWGFVSSVANVAFQEITGKDFGDTMLALVEGKEDVADVVASAAAQTNGESGEASSSASAPVAQTLAMATVSPATVDPTALATIAPQLTTAADRPPSGATAQNGAATAALMSALTGKGIDPALSQRALAAYKRSLAQPQPSADTVPVF